MKYDITEKKVCPHKTLLKNLYSNTTITLPTQYAMKVKRAVNKMDYRAFDLLHVGPDTIPDRTELFKLTISLPKSENNANIKLKNNISLDPRHRRTYLINMRGFIVLKIPNSIKQDMINFLALKEHM